MAKDDDDLSLFRRTMAAHGIKKASYQADKITPEKPTATVKLSSRPTNFTGSEQLKDLQPLKASAVDETDVGPHVLFIRSGADKNLIRQLRRGTLMIDESIDLHGMRSRDAGKALEGFLQESLHYGYRSIQIIHGKGQGSEQPGGVLKPLTINWLKQQPAVLGFCSAMQNQGGTGATNVLLGHTN